MDKVTIPYPWYQIVNGASAASVFRNVSGVLFAQPGEVGAQRVDVDEVMTQLTIAMPQHRHAFAVQGFELLVRIDIEQFQGNAGSGRQGTYGRFHVVTQMTVAALNQDERRSHRAGISCHRPP